MRRMMFILLALGMSMVAMPVSGQQPQLQLPIDQDGISKAMGSLLALNINMESALRSCLGQSRTQAERIGVLEKELADEKAKNAKPPEAPK